MSGGVIYAGGGTSVQEEAGVQDDVEEMYKYLRLEVGEVVAESTLRKFCAGSAADVTWLAEHGVRFKGVLWPTKTSYPNPNYFLYHSDNSLVPRYAAAARPAARGHRGYTTSRKAIGLGGTIYNPLRKAADEAGVRVRRQCEVRALVVDAAGRVVGVKVLEFPDAQRRIAARQVRLERRGQRLMRVVPPAVPGAALFHSIARRWLNRARALNEKRELRFYRAQRGVCLAAGGFIFNRDMVRHYAPNYRRGMPLAVLATMAQASAWGSRWAGPPT